MTAGDGGENEKLGIRNEELKTGNVTAGDGVSSYKKASGQGEKTMQNSKKKMQGSEMREQKKLLGPFTAEDFLLLALILLLWESKAEGSDLLCIAVLYIFLSDYIDLSGILGKLAEATA